MVHGSGTIFAIRILIVLVNELVKQKKTTGIIWMFDKSIKMGYRVY